MTSSISFKTECQSSSSTNIANRLTPNNDFYKALKIAFENSQPIYLQDVSGSIRAVNCTFLNEGGSKKIYKISDSEVLIVPNIQNGVGKDLWDRLCNEELSIGEHVKKLNLLTPENIPVNISLSTDFEGPILKAYVTRNFYDLAKKDGFIIIESLIASPIWKQYPLNLFPNYSDKLIEENWNKATVKLLDDLAIAYIHKIPLNYDSVHLVIFHQPKDSDKDTKVYELRLFFYDFTDKRQILDLDDLKHNIIQKNRISSTKIERYVDMVFDIIFRYEFNSIYRPSTQELEKKLIENYAQYVFDKAKSILNEYPQSTPKIATSNFNSN